MSVSAPVVDEVELAIGGMTCGACAARVQRALNKLDGVEASVNYATSTGRVVLSAPLGVERLIAVVEKAGYTAEPVVADTDAVESDVDARIRSLWPRLVVALVLCAPLGDLSIGLVLAPSLRFPGWRWLLLVLTIPVATWCAWPFHRAAWRNACHGLATMDTLVSVGVLAASLWSLYTIFFVRAGQPSGAWGLLLRPSGSIYLDVAAGVTTFVIAGRLLEAQAKRKAGGALRALAEAGAKDAWVLEADGSTRRAPVDAIHVGDRLLVRPGEIIATDGVVVDGRAGLDTASMTGEHAPVTVATGDAVLGGTTNLDGVLVVEATRVGRDTRMAQLVRLVETAQHDKASVQRQADRISAVFVPVVFVLAALTFIGWLAAGDPGGRAFGPALAVLVIACPCALGLATPTALLVASGRGAQLGIFIKGHHAIEAARVVDTVVLDKTGTLTEGRMSVAGAHSFDGGDTGEMVRLAAAVEAGSRHAIAAAIVASGTKLITPARLPAVTDFVAIAGLGALGDVEGRRVLVGSRRLLAEHRATLPSETQRWTESWAARGCSIVLVAVDGRCVGGLALSDTVKPSAVEAVSQLQDLGLRTVLLTGDHAAAAQAVGSYLGIDEVISDVLPADKAAAVERLQSQGHAVAMVGDGVNDAPALARADLGLAVVSGSDVALGAADLILVRDDLVVVPTAIRLARSTLRTIRGNLLWAFGYNVAAIPLAAAGLLNPLIAGAAMATSSLFVVTNSLRLNGFDRAPGAAWGASWEDESDSDIAAVEANRIDAVDGQQVVRAV